MKKAFSALLISAFLVYVIVVHRFTSSPKPQEVSIPDQQTAAPTAIPAPAQTPAPTPVGMFVDGTYKGASVYAYYGNIQVGAVIQGGKLSDVKIYDYPRDRDTSVSINSQALPILISEAIQAQSAEVDAVSGASDTSPAFNKSLASALTQAKR